MYWFNPVHISFWLILYRGTLNSAPYKFLSAEEVFKLYEIVHAFIQG